MAYQSGTERMSVRLHLLTTASVLALATSASMSSADAAVIVIDATGSSLNYSNDDTHFFDPDSAPNPGNNSFGAGPHQGQDFGAKVWVQPDGLDLIFSAGFQYAKSDKHSSSAYGTFPTHYTVGKFTGNGTGSYGATATHRESHTILDFQVGKDLGIGLFGHGGKSVVSFGVRYTKFTSRTDVAFQTASKYSILGGEGGGGGGGGSRLPRHHAAALAVINPLATVTTGAGFIVRDFSALGPELSIDASTPFSDDGGLELDWGADLGILFGRQKVANQVTFGGAPYANLRKRQSTSPFVGGYIGLGYRFAQGENISFGFKVDTFSDVFDGSGPSVSGFGFAPAHNVSHTSYGPYVKVSIPFGG